MAKKQDNKVVVSSSSAEESKTVTAGLTVKVDTEMVNEAIGEKSKQELEPEIEAGKLLLNGSLKQLEQLQTWLAKRVAMKRANIVYDKNLQELNKIKGE